MGSELHASLMYTMCFIAVCIMLLTQWLRCITEQYYDWFNLLVDMCTNMFEVWFARLSNLSSLDDTKYTLQLFYNFWKNASITRIEIDKIWKSQTIFNFKAWHMIHILKATNTAITTMNARFVSKKFRSLCGANHFLIW